MKKLIGATTALSLLLTSTGALALNCKYSKDKMPGPDGSPLTQTKPSRVTGPVQLSAMFNQDSKYLGVNWHVTDYFPKPEDMKKKDPEFKEFKQAIKNDTFIFPAGSTLRFNFTDRTSHAIELGQDYRFTGELTEPGKKYKVKGLMGFVASATDVEIEGVDTDKNPNWRVDAEALMAFPLSDRDIAVLSQKNPMGMRLESRDRYFHSDFTVQPMVENSEPRGARSANKKLREMFDCIAQRGAK